MRNAQLVLIIPVGDSNLPDFGGGIPAIGGRPDNSLPSHGHISNRPPGIPPYVVWPPQFPNRPDNTLPPEFAKPSNPINLPEGAQLPEGAAFVAIYTATKGWHHAVVQGAQPK